MIARTSQTVCALAIAIARRLAYRIAAQVVIVLVLLVVFSVHKSDRRTVQRDKVTEVPTMYAMFYLYEYKKDFPAVCVSHIISI